MANAYTCIIEDNDDVTFREFAKRCARQIDYMFHMREEDFDVPLHAKKEVEDTYTLDSIKRMRRRVAEDTRELQRLQKMSREDILAEYEKEKLEEETAYADRKAEYDVKMARYLRMRSFVEAWTPPSDQHVGLKIAMLATIEDSMPTQPQQPTIGSVDDWYARSIQYLERSIAWQKENEARDLKLLEERACAMTSQEWLDLLNASLDAYGK